MYRIELNNCCCEHSIKMEFTFEPGVFAEVICLATGGFRSVKVTDAETGELLYDRYVCSQHFEIDQSYQYLTNCIKDLLLYAKCPKGF